MPNFEVYQRQQSGSRRRRGMTVTVTSRGSMCFSQEAWAALGSPEAVKFLVDQDPGQRVVGFKACKRGEDNAHAVTPGTHSVSAVALLKYLHYGFGTFRHTLKVEDGLPPYIDLNEDAPAVTSNRRKASTVPTTPDGQGAATWDDAANAVDDAVARATGETGRSAIDRIAARDARRRQG
jgi:hypothetical protein